MLPRDLVIVQTYIQNYEAEDNEIKCKNIIEGNSCKVIMGTGMEEKYSLRIRNKRGDRSVEFCLEKKFFIVRWFDGIKKEGLHG